MPIVAAGYELYTSDEMNNPHYLTYYNKGEHVYYGSKVIVTSITAPLDINKFSSEMREKLPKASHVIGIRYSYVNQNMIDDMTQANKDNGHWATSRYQPYSDKYRLPEATFLSFSQKMRVSDKKFITVGSAVRDNENVYFFVKPQDGQQYSMPLSEFSQSATTNAIKIAESDQ
jgi:hypothetical protein